MRENVACMSKIRCRRVVRFLSHSTKIITYVAQEQEMKGFYQIIARGITETESLINTFTVEPLVVECLQS